MARPARFWIGVASREHVRAGIAGGFCQLCHGRAAPLRRLEAGDRLIYYSPRTAMRGGEPVQAFTAIGEVVAGAPYPFDMGGGFVPFRRDIRFLPAFDAPIAPLLETLSFTRGRRSWGYAFRRGVFEATAADHAAIAAAMGVADRRMSVSA
ncbi:MAG: EVE domain-containing protein [Rhodospirillales bacterium]